MAVEYIYINGLHLYSAFIYSAVQLMSLIRPFTLTHQQRLAALQGTNQHVRSNWGLGVLLRDAQGGIEPATLRLPDDCSYLLSHIGPYILLAFNL